LGGDFRGYQKSEWILITDHSDVTDLSLQHALGTKALPAGSRSSLHHVQLLSAATISAIGVCEADV
jgi:hypothetical protein